MIFRKALVAVFVSSMLGGHGAWHGALPVAAAAPAASAPASTQPPPGRESAEPAAASSPAPLNQLIPVVMPDLTSEATQATLELPPSLLPEHAHLFAERLLQQTAETQIQQLQVSQPAQQKQMSHYRFRPDLAAIETVTHTAQLPEVTPNTSTAASAEASGCTSHAVDELAKQLTALRQYQTMRDAAPATRIATADGPAAAPRIIVTNYAIFGTAAPHTLISLRLSRNGTLVTTLTTKSDAKGEFAFYPQYHDCPTLRYEWELMLGDEVSVTANGETARTHVTPLSVEVDPTTNRLFGVTTPSHLVKLKLFQPSVNCSEVALMTRTVQADSAGNFSLIADYDVDNSAYVIAESSASPDGHAMQAQASAFGIRMYPGGSNIYFILLHGVPYTATLWRGDTAMTRQTGRMSELASRSASVSYYAVQPGDVWVVEGGGLRFSMTATYIGANLNLAADQIQVTTQANSRVRAYLYRSSYAYISDATTNCGRNQQCASGLSDGSGNFSIAADTDLVRGDGVYVESFDPQGNRLIGRIINTRSITAYLGDYPGISVQWSAFADKLHILHRDAHGAIKGDFERQYSSYFSVYSEAGVLPGDVIEAGDGVLTETMTVQAIDARLDSKLNLLTGAGSNGPLSAALNDFDPTTYRYTLRCAYSPTGQLPLAFANAQMSGHDYAWVMRMGPDGHFTERDLSTFSVYVNQYNRPRVYTPYVYVSLEQPDTTVTLTLRTGDVVKDISVTKSGKQNYAYVYYLGDNLLFKSGDTLDVATSDGYYATVPITNLTLAFEGEPNHAFGTAPANQPVLIDAWRTSNSNYYWIAGGLETASNAQGNFDVDLGPVYLRNYCARVSMSHPCISGRVTYYTPAGHAVMVLSLPTPIAADPLEPDSSFPQATPYTAPQQHTLHNGSDMDLVSFTVSQADVDGHTPYLFQLSELGWEMNVLMEVYDADYKSLASKTAREYNRSSISLEWTPKSAGKYYLYISPGNTYLETCDSVYTLTLFPIRTRLRLPVVGAK